MRYIVAFLLMVSTCFGQVPPAPAPPKPLPLPVIAERYEIQYDSLHLKEIWFYYNPVDPYDMVWYRALKRDMFIPWKNWIPKTNRYHDASQIGKQKLMKLAERMDRRVSKIGVKIHVAEAEVLGYKIGSKYQKFHKLSRRQAPCLTFWIRFAEYHEREYDWKAVLKEHKENHYKLEEKVWGRYFSKWLVKWLQKDKYMIGGIRRNDLKPSDFTVVFNHESYEPILYSTYGSFFCTKEGASCECDFDLSDEGFRPPAIAEKPAPNRFENPLNYLLIGEDE